MSADCSEPGREEPLSLLSEGQSKNHSRAPGHVCPGSSRSLREGCRLSASVETLPLPSPSPCPQRLTHVSSQELEAWTTDFALPTTVWLAGFFNPQSFLTAIMQSMARKNEWPLDKMCLSVEVTKKNREDMTAPPREGSYVYGLFMEGDSPPGSSQGHSHSQDGQAWARGGLGATLSSRGGLAVWGACLTPAPVRLRLGDCGDSVGSRKAPSS